MSGATAPANGSARVASSEGAQADAQRAGDHPNRARIQATAVGPTLAPVPPDGRLGSTVEESASGQQVPRQAAQGRENAAHFLRQEPSDRKEASEKGEAGSKSQAPKSLQQITASLQGEAEVPLDLPDEEGNYELIIVVQYGDQRVELRQELPTTSPKP